MLSNKDTEEIMSWILTIGTLFSAILVLIGGSLYLYQHGGETLQLSMLNTTTSYTSLRAIWSAAITFTPLGIVEIGILALVATQVLRVALLIWFYASIRDYLFAFISLFILSMLIYSFFPHRY